MLLCAIIIILGGLHNATFIMGGKFPMLFSKSICRQMLWFYIFLASRQSSFYWMVLLDRVEYPLRIVTRETRTLIVRHVTGKENFLNPK